MDLGNIFIIIMMMHYTVHIGKMIIFKNRRQAMQGVNIRLNKLRSKPIKTLEEQKEFINLKNPKSIGRFKWTWMTIPNLIRTIIPYVIVFQIYRYILNHFGIVVPLWMAILFIIIFPIIMNIILAKFGIEKGDISVFFRGGKKK